MEGPEALKTIVEQLEGFEAPAGAWETEILPARLENYDPAWLDDHCLAGRIAWARLRPVSERLNGGERSIGARASPHDSDYFAHAAVMLRSGRPFRRSERAPSRASARKAVVERHAGARSFLLRRAGGRHGLVAVASRRSTCRACRHRSCEFGQFCRPARAARAVRPAQVTARKGTGAGVRGRSAWSRPADGRSPAGPRRAGRGRSAEADAVEHVARTLLLRYGVVFRRSSSGRRPGCRSGGICCVFIADSRRAETFAAAALSPVSRASNSRCRTRSACCARSGASRSVGGDRLALGCRSAQFRWSS